LYIGVIVRESRKLGRRRTYIKVEKGLIRALKSAIVPSLLKLKSFLLANSVVLQKSSTIITILLIKLPFILYTENELLKAIKILLL
jgi:hypothetical protein